MTKKVPAAKTARPPGKKSNPEYTQVTCYVRKETYAEARKLLIDLDQDFSDLVEKLTADWVRKKKGAQNKA